ncbi:MAG: methylated-DNA--[protein]-cysteine S-methyltransferase [Actinomycetes bacterium]
MQTDIAGLRFVSLPDSAELSYTTVTSPVGELVLTGSGEVLTGLFFGGPGEVLPGFASGEGAWVFASDALAQARGQLEQYFAGERSAFDLELAVTGTDFQRRVWRALCDIPFGRTISYRQLAEAIGQPGAGRAVGSANSRNRIAVIIPCHRVIASSGSPGGYSGGLDRKQTLLQLENASVSLPQFRSEAV